MTQLFVTDRDGTTHELDAQPGDTIMEIVRDAGLGIEAICGGQCACATCHCFFDESWSARLPEPSEDEVELAESSEHFEAGRSRLTCQIYFSEELEGVELTIAPEE